MTVVVLGMTELYEPWKLSEEVPAAGFPLASDLPDELIQRFQRAKAEMEAVWEEMRRFPRWAV